MNNNTDTDIQFDYNKFEFTDINSKINDNTNKKQIIDFLNSCDQRRSTDWKQTFPELVEKLS